jgi:hypothetical protein
MHTSAMLVAHGTRHTGTARMPSATQAVERTESLLNMEGVDVKASLRGLHTLNARSNTASVPVIYLTTSPYTDRADNPYTMVHKALVDALKALKALHSEFQGKWLVARATEALRKKSVKRTRMGLPKVHYSVSWAEE